MLTRLVVITQGSKKSGITLTALKTPVTKVLKISSSWFTNGTNTTRRYDLSRNEFIKRRMDKMVFNYYYVDRTLIKKSKFSAHAHDCIFHKIFPKVFRRIFYKELYEPLKAQADPLCMKLQFV